MDRKIILFSLFILSLLCFDIQAQISGFYACHTRLAIPNIAAIETHFREDAQQYRNIISREPDKECLYYYSTQ